MLAGKLYTCITEEKQLADMRVRKNRFLDRFNGTAFEDCHIFLWTLYSLFQLQISALILSINRLVVSIRI